MEFVDESGTDLIDSKSYEGSYFSKYPHIHLHAVVDGDRVADGDDGVAELCCHCCGFSTYLVFNIATLVKYPGGVPCLQEVKYEFIEKHADCASKVVKVGAVELLSHDFKFVCPPGRGKTVTYSIKEEDEDE